MKNFILSLSIFLLASSTAFPQNACEPWAVKLLTTAAAPPTPSSFKKMEETVISPDTDVLVLGDSIAEMLVGKTDLAKALQAKKLLDWSGGGDGLQNAIYRLTARPELTKINPSVIVILVGTNNINAPACATNAGIDKYLHLIRSKWPDSRMYVVPILPRGDFFNDFVDSRAAINDFYVVNSYRYQYSIVSISDTEMTCGAAGNKAAVGLQAKFKSGICSAEENFPFATAVGALNGSAEASCTTKRTLTCDTYSADNIHLTKDGLEKVKEALVKAVAVSK